MELTIITFTPIGLGCMKSRSVRLPLSTNNIIESATAFRLKPCALLMDTCHG